jgi:hypothetical protein
VFVYGDNGLKSNFGGHHNRHRGNIYGYVGTCFYGNPCQSCATPAAQAHAEYTGNTCVFRNEKTGYGSDCGFTAGVLVGNNSIFSQDGQLDVCAGTPNSTRLAAWQAQGHDKGTELGVWPGDAQLALQVRQLLGF